ncbi:MAG: hypothetical protein ACREIA_10300 [Opitutaceae bacterium]
MRPFHPRAIGAVADARGLDGFFDMKQLLNGLPVFLAQISVAVAAGFFFWALL